MTPPSLLERFGEDPNYWTRPRSGPEVVVTRRRAKRKNLSYFGKFWSGIGPETAGLTDKEIGPVTKAGKPIRRAPKGWAWQRIYVFGRQLEWALVHCDDRCRRRQGVQGLYNYGGAPNRCYLRKSSVGRPRMGGLKCLTCRDRGVLPVLAVVPPEIAQHCVLDVDGWVDQRTGRVVEAERSGTMKCPECCERAVLRMIDDEMVARGANFGFEQTPARLMSARRYGGRPRTLVSPALRRMNYRLLSSVRFIGRWRWVNHLRLWELKLTGSLYEDPSASVTVVYATPTISRECRWNYIQRVRCEMHVNLVFPRTWGAGWAEGAD